MIAIDWSHTKQLTTYDGKKVKQETLEALIKRESKDGVGGESKLKIKSATILQSPTFILEEGCPLRIAYKLLGIGKVYTISNRATQDYRVEHSIEKSDETDARIIYELSQNGVKLKQIVLNDSDLQMYSLYHQYCRYQKARVAMMSMKKSHQRHFGDGDSKVQLKSTTTSQPSPDLSPYDIAIDVLKAREKIILKSLEKMVGG